MNETKMNSLIAPCLKMALTTVMLCWRVDLATTKPNWWMRPSTRLRAGAFPMCPSHCQPGWHVRLLLW